MEKQQRSQHGKRRLHACSQGAGDLQPLCPRLADNGRRSRRKRENKFVSYSERITFNPQMMGGQACIRGMRIPVSLVLNLMAQELPAADILREYPDLELEDLQACLSYGAWLAREEVLPHQAQF